MRGNGCASKPYSSWCVGPRLVFPSSGPRRHGTDHDRIARLGCVHSQSVIQTLFAKCSPLVYLLALSPVARLDVSRYARFKLLLLVSTSYPVY
jgi:hypothetical protein